MKFVMIYGASGVGKESVGRELARRNGWHLFPQHLAFDVACAVVGFGNAGFEKYQRKVCLDAFRTLAEDGASGIVFTFCYVRSASDFFVEGLCEFLDEFGITAEFVHLTCDYGEHVQRVTSPNRLNTNKIQSKAYLDNYLDRFDFSTLPGMESFHLDSSRLTIATSARQIENHLHRAA